MGGEKEKIRIGITQGDVNGIGYEVILKALSDENMLDLCTPIVYGSKRYSTEFKRLLKMDEFSFFFIQKAEDAKSNVVNLIDSCGDEGDLNIGEPTVFSGKAAFQSLNRAVDDLIIGNIDAVVTAPINKKNIQSENFNFPGHTEFLGQKDGGNKALMFMISEKLKVGVVTGHIPLKDVASSISEEKIIKKLRVMSKSLESDFNFSKPKIAVLGLNPHAGDNGLLGREEEDIVKGAVIKACEEGILAHGPFPADGFFGSSQYLKYDGVLAMYHDQGLIPFKALSFGEGVNYTAGLSFVRTSPDHGTGYDIAGQNKADASSMRKAIYSAIDISRNRTLNGALKANALKPQKMEDTRGKRFSDRRSSSRPEKKFQNKSET
jgi:4-hydroxythreonine-4-phosphate dehydrogenase